ncbi:glycosyltransferase family 4 protein [Anaeromyxobacter oryzae]|uniref:Glycosyl transferase group 1 n=1 Tax=Anaeromyxobacter oryzae TaxID=2918170 RepID=A0ABN6MLZ8_9BACT|nr:glycosyltransferase family 4 protein [Anaeromyxobacter oryzae]BDG02082.1 hypothetical protein AMOR_10780 [Anaeromyxobacter oryzae]
MKVLLHSDAVGGVFTYAVELARALAARGVRIVLATEGARLRPDQRAAVSAIPGVVLAEGAFRLEWMPEPWDDVARAGAWLLELERRERPDVVHLNAFAHGALPFRAPKLVVGHSCVLSWFEAVKGTPAPAGWDRYRRAVRAGLRGAGAVAAPSRAMADALVRHHGPIPAPFVVPNGRDPARFQPGRKEPIVLGAGRLWDEAKDAAALVAVAPQLPWAVYIAGAERVDGGETPPSPREGRGGEDAAVAMRSRPLTPALSPAQEARGGEGVLTKEASSYARGRGSTNEGSEIVALTPALSPAQEARGGEQARARGARSYATLLGRLSEADLAGWLARASIFAHPARYEPFGLAVLEAALAGCALVLADLPSLRETWDDAAVFVPPGDRAALARALRTLAEDDGRRAAYAGAARTRALAFGPDRLADGTLALYRHLLAHRAGASAPP